MGATFCRRENGLGFHRSSRERWRSAFSWSFTCERSGRKHFHVNQDAERRQLKRCSHVQNERLIGNAKDEEQGGRKQRGALEEGRFQE
jgi:hypothetical protein